MSTATRNTAPQQTAEHPYGNFRHPAGLLFRMLRSGNRAAYSALLREALRLILVPLDLLLSPIERRRLTTARGTGQPLVLVVGPPRSGTTLVSQVLTSCLDVSYISNVSALFPRSPITATHLFRRIAQRPAADFSSFYGQTSRLSGPHDGFFIWDRWLESDRYCPVTDLSPDQLCDMRNFFHAWSDTCGRPLLNKNNRNTSCVDFLADALEDACFVVVRRDAASTVRSLIRAREQVQGDKLHPWGLASQETHCRTDALGYVDDVCQQVLRIEADLSQRLALIDPCRVYEIRYEDFCERPREILSELTEQFSGLELATNAMVRCPDSFERSASSTLTNAEEARISLCLSRTEQQPA